MKLHSRVRLQALEIGADRAPLLVVDDFVEDPEALRALACRMTYEPRGAYYPGVRATAPDEYCAVFSGLKNAIAQHFSLTGRYLSFQARDFSLITTPPGQLALTQRVPHFDSLPRAGLACVHYLFHGAFGGTSFYRHRKTGFEFVDETRYPAYRESLLREELGPALLGEGYINGDTPLFERIAAQEGVFNRLIVYRQNSLHSGS